MSRILLLIACLPLVAGVACNGGDDPGDCVAHQGQQPQSHYIGAVFSGTDGHAPARGKYDQGVGGGGVHEGRFVINSITLPQSRQDYGIDLNGDGRVDNQWGNIVGALSSNGMNPQPGEDQEVAHGAWTELLQLDSSDSSFQSDSCAQTQVQKAQTSTPAFDGTDHFTIDTGYSPAHLNGPIQNFKFSSAPPATTKHPVTMTVGLNFFGFPAKLPLNGVHLQYTYAGGRLMSGQINGAVKEADLSNTVIPAIADEFNSQIQSDPNGSDTNQIEQDFDVGDGKGGQCANTDVTDKRGVSKGDGVIAVCEVATNMIIKSVLAPDVQMFDAAGNYAPNKDNTTKDSLSVGFGFTAVPAEF